ncbi:acetyl-CoA acetyltransferase [Kordiimonas sediminis]|uniref:Acetyl-CoA acetyltransferase n=1 Tax=Kordiimonas sediminis TaxID=1735581 RepID=A0A919E618_9PROT|nr:acetyl-CoA C-acyltransferase [Kordiimonas sediminis]GHF17579.1 acetyl-CoA acetyltransferase [Kordiimonas sediminis]
MSTPNVFICDAVRTARGKAKDTGGLHAVKPADLMAKLYLALADRNGLDLNTVDDVVLGCVTQVGDQGSNIARTSALLTEKMDTVGGVTVTRYCTSGLDAAILAATKIQSGLDTLNITGGIESMSRVPMLADKGAFFVDADVATRAKSVPLGISADLIASLYGISRMDADTYAATSQARAAAARANGYFQKSIIPITNPETGQIISEDECIREGTTAETLAGMEPSFAGLGAKGFDAAIVAMFDNLEAITHIHHAGNSPAMCDGGSAVILASDEALSATGLKPRAKILSMANGCVTPVMGLTGGFEAAKLAMQKAGMTASDIDLVEFNEAFAAVSVQFLNDSGFSHDQVNVNGGAIAMGHAMGSSGTALIGILLDELERRGLQTGLVSLSGGAGVGTAMVLERV